MGCALGRKKIKINSLVFSVDESLNFSSQSVPNKYPLKQTVSKNDKIVGEFNLNAYYNEDDNKISTIQENFSNCKISDLYDIIHAIEDNIIYVVKHKKTQMKMIMKIISKSEISCDDFFISQFHQIQSLSHINVIKYREYFVDKINYYIVTEYLPNAQALNSLKSLSESAIREIMKQILCGILYLHVNNIIHRDIQLEHILIAKDKNDNIRAKIFHLEKSIYHKENPNTSLNLYEKIGNVCFIAPEVIRKNYSFKCDIWSAGVIMYYICYENLPFFGDSEQEIMAKVKIGNFEINDNSRYISNEAIDLIRKMLDVSQYTRMNAYELLSHSFFKENPIPKDKNGLVALLQESVKMIIKNEYFFDDFSTLKSLYNQLNIKYNHSLSYHKLQEIFQVEIKEIENYEPLSFKEFIEKVLSEEMVLNSNNISKMFSFIDIDKDGILSKYDYKEFFTFLLYSGETLGYFLYSLESKKMTPKEFEEHLKNYEMYIDY